MTEHCSHSVYAASGPPYLHYYCAVVVHSCILLPPVGHSSNHECHCCQLTRQSSCFLKFYRTFKAFIWLSLVLEIVFVVINYKLTKLYLWCGQGSVVSLVTRLDDTGFDSCMGQEVLLFLPVCTDCLWGPFSLLFQWVQTSSLRLKWLKCEANQLSPCNSNITAKLFPSNAA
jgi:hypothetical protein